MKSDKFYITTPIYYVNDEPHIGHAYTTVLADVLARYHRLFGQRVFFLTGVDEHGQKLKEAAQAAGQDPQAFCDRMVGRFLATWKKLNITNDDFIRTTSDRHKKVVRHILSEIYRKGEIYTGQYEGWYCVPEERFWTEKDLMDGNCPSCGRGVKRIAERNYFFRMGKYQDWLIGYIQDHPSFIQPATRRNEVLGFLNRPLGDLCISRPRKRLSWGIPLPFDPDYVTYVWFDALINYVSAIGYDTDDSAFQRWWPATYHLIGKDILTTHCVYWPTMLKAAGIPLPETVFAHGWWLIKETKMSKSLGNVVRPLELADRYGVDPLRYFLMREMVLGQDASFSEEAFRGRYDSDLANDLGNLVSRLNRMVASYFDGKIPSKGGRPAVNELVNQALRTPKGVKELVEGLKVNQAVETVLNLIRRTNKYLEDEAPWKLIRVDRERTAGVLYNALEALRIAVYLLYPIMPSKMGELLDWLGVSPSAVRFDQDLVWGKLTPGRTLSDRGALFPRIGTKEIRVPIGKQIKEELQEMITIEDFKMVDLRVARVVSAERVPGADKLLKIKIDLGTEQRQIVAGIAEHYTPEDLVGKDIAVVINLKPARIRGVESNGMLLAAEDKDGVVLVTLDQPTQSGTKIS